MKKFFCFEIPLFIVAILAGCATTNTTTTETFYDDTGEAARVVITEELSDDAMYYRQAATAISKQGRGCGDNCAPGEAGNIEAFRTIRMLMGKGFVEKGMNGVEAAATIGGAIVNHSPYYMLGLGLYKALDSPSSVTISGENNRYTTSESHWTGNRMNDGNTFEVPYRNGSPDSTTTTTTTDTTTAGY